MSSAPKRPHEEVGQSSSKYPLEDSGAHPKPSSTSANEYQSQYDTSQDSRMSKIPRTESRDVDRRSPLHTVYGTPLSSSNETLPDHPARSDSKMESKDPKDMREIRGESRDAKTDSREAYGEAKRDSQSAKGEKDVRRTESKDSRHDTGIKTGKDGFGSGTSNLGWKEAKEYSKGKGYSGSLGGNMDTWHISRSNSQRPVEVAKEGPSTDERDNMEINEAVGENKVDPKAEDKYKDRDRKRQEAKHRDWAEKEKQRSDGITGMQVGNSSSESKEIAKEEGDSEKEKKERKDLSREKERPKEREREKDPIKRDSWNGAEKESLHSEKSLGDTTTKMSEQESLIPDQKKQKDSDGLKNIEGESRDKMKERDTDVDGDRPGKRNKSHEKESEDGCGDGEVATEREKEVFGHGIQQKRRMPRPRSSPQRAIREPRFRASSADVEGSQGKAEVASVVYKVGECMQELTNLWKEFESTQAVQSGESSQNGPTLEIRIPSEHVTATNRQVRGGQLWGTDIYTYDSDLVAVLMHTGYCRPTASPPPPSVQELRATIRVLPPQECYISTLRNNVRSRAWGAAIGCSYRVERCCIVKKGGGTIDLEPCLSHASTVEPTLAPVAVERTMTTRAAASNALRQQRFLREVTIQYNLCNEPWIKYSLNVVADKGLKKPLYTSARLKKGEVLYLETHTKRYELCFTGEKVVKATTPAGHEGEAEKQNNSNSTNGERNDSENVVTDVFRWSRCKKPLPQKVMRSIGIPLPPEHVEVLEENLEWEDVQWSQTSVWIKEKEYPLARAHFLSVD